MAWRGENKYQWRHMAKSISNEIMAAKTSAKKRKYHGSSSGIAWRNRQRNGAIMAIIWQHQRKRGMASAKMAAAVAKWKRWR